MVAVEYHCLRGKRVLVTGGASGIGAAIVEAFLHQGAAVDFFDCNAEDAQKLCASLPAGNLFFYEGDSSKPSEVLEWVKRAEQRFSGIDVLVNNVASDHRHSLEAIDLDYLDHNVALNFKSHIYAIRSVLPAMKAQRAGCVINLSSNCFMLGLTGYPLYASAKAALVGLTRSLAREYGGEGIRVNALIPGWVMTKRQLHCFVTPKAIEDLLGEQCIKETIKPHDIANAAIFLASSQARFITAQSLIVDGGRA